MLVQSEPHSHTEYVHLEPSPDYGSSWRNKDFHVVRAEKTLVSVQYSIHLSTAVCDIQCILQLLLSM
jgi:hypothetical protein